mgnify:CR=1 FL=1|jgi:pilin isopeptide linkage protein
MASSHHAQPFSRRILVAFLSLLMVVSTVPTSAVADAVRARASEALSAEALEQVLTARMGRTYEVSFDANGGEGEMDPVKVGEEPRVLVADDGDEAEAEAPEDLDTSAYLIELPDSSFTRNGFAFSGWSTTPDNQDIVITERDEESGKDVSRLETPAVFVSPDTTIDRFVFPSDVDGDGSIAEGEVADLFSAVDDEGRITLFAQWEEVPVVEEDLETANATPIEAPEDEEPLVLEEDPEMVEAPAATFTVTPQASTQASAEGTTIENVAVEWIDSNESVLALTPTSDALLQMRARVRIALSGQNSYDPGTVQVRVPKSLFQDRNGRSVGQMGLAVPKAPSTAATFAYTVEGDSYVLANVKKLSAATQTSFEFTIDGIKPSSIVSGSLSKPFSATATVVLPSGTSISADSNAIECRIDTAVSIDAAYVVADRLGIKDHSFVPSEMLPGNPDDYIYASFRTYAYTSGVQPFDATVTARDTSGIPGALLLGDQTLAFSSSFTGTTGSKEFYVAYPREHFVDGNTYELTLDADWACVGVDTKIRTEKSASGSQRYSPLSFENPTGAFNVFKDGIGGHTDGVTVTSSIKDDGKSVSYSGLWADGLDRIADGEDVEVAWQARTVGFAAPHTWVDTNNDGVAGPEEYGQKPVDFEVVDDTLRFDHEDSALTLDDIELTRLVVDEFTVRHWTTAEEVGNAYRHEAGGVSWGRVEPGDWCYLPCSADAATGKVVLSVTKDGSSWLVVGTYDPVTGSYEASSGAVADGDGIAVPKGYLAWKAELSTRSDAVDFIVRPQHRLKASSATVSTAVAELFKGANDPETVLDNDVSISVFADGRKKIFERTKTARNELVGASVAAFLDNNVSVTNDVSRQRAGLTYNIRLSKETNFASLASAKAARGRGTLLAESSGTFYDLLPKGVVVNTDAASVVDGYGRTCGTVTSIERIPDWRGSGRDLLVCCTDIDPDATLKLQNGRVVETFTLVLNASMTWASIADYGTEPVNVCAYQSANRELGNVAGKSGEPDDPSHGNHMESSGAVAGFLDLMRDLDANGDDPAFVYARCEEPLSVDRAYATGLTKTVSVGMENTYTSGIDSVSATGTVHDERNSWSGGSYTYRVHIENDEATTLTGIRVFDAVEDFVPTAGTDAGDRRWAGELESVDVSQLRDAGIDPVIYYSTRDDLVLDDSTNRNDTDLGDRSVWSTERPSHVGAVAIDCSRAIDGSVFTLGRGQSISAYINMRAPSVDELAANEGVDKAEIVDTTIEDPSDEATSGGWHAYNNVTMIASKQDASGALQAEELIHQDYTKVGLAELSIEVRKVWDDDSNRDGVRPDSVTVHLLIDGKRSGYDAVLNADNGWSHIFEGLDGSLGEWTVSEDVPLGYSMSQRVTATGSGRVVRITNRHKVETLSLSGAKVWDDDSNAAGCRPEYVVLGVWAKLPGESGNGSMVRSFRVYAPDGEGSSDTWEWTVEGLPAFKEGQRLIYSVHDVNPGSAYVESSSDVTDDSGHTFKVVNKYEPFGTIEITKEIQSGDPEATHAVVIDAWDRAGAPLTGGVAISWGDGQTDTYKWGDAIELKGGETVTLVDVPEGTSYRVSEDLNLGWTQVRSDGESGTVTSGKASKCTLVNRYDCSGSVTIRATKSLQGRHLTANEFRFTLQRIAEDGSSVSIIPARNDADGNIVFPEISFDESDLGKTYTYQVSEDTSLFNGVSMDHHTETIKVTPKDNGDGTMTVEVVDDGDVSFNNSYFATGYAFEIQVSKELPAFEDVLGAWSGKEVMHNAYTNALFTVGVYDEDGNRVGGVRVAPGEKATLYGPRVSTSDGDVIGKTFTYTLREDPISDDDVSSAAGIFGLSDLGDRLRESVVMDDHEVTFSVTIRDRGNGNLYGELQGDAPTAEELTFKNSWKPSSLQVTKETDGTGDPAKEFRFHAEVSGISDGTESGGWLNPDGSIDVVYPGEPINFATGEGSFSDSTKNHVADYDPTGTYGTVPEVVAPDGHDFLWWQDGDGNKVELSEARPGDTLTAFYLDCTWSGGEKQSFGTCWWGLGEDKALWIIPQDGKEGTLGSVQEYTTEDGRTYFETPDWSYFSSIHSLGTIHGGESMAHLFEGEFPIEDMSDLAGWDVSGVKDMSFCFGPSWNNYAQAEVGHDGIDVEALSHWDVSSVEKMDSMFASGYDDTDSFKNGDVSPLASWDVSNVRSMDSMFEGTNLSDASALGAWDVSQVVSMGSMFESTDLMDLSFIASWDTSKVENYSRFLALTPESLDLTPLASLDTSSARCISYFLDVPDASNTFFTRNWGDGSFLASWDVSKVEDMSGLFKGAGISSLDATAGWDTSSVRDMSYLLNGATVGDLSAIASWNTSSVQTLEGAFSNYGRTGQDGGESAVLDLMPVAGWDVSNVTDMAHLCGLGTMTDSSGSSYKISVGLSSLDLGPLASWDTSSVTDLSGAFEQASFVDGGADALASWDTSSVTDLSEIFRDSNVSSVSMLASWDTSSVTDLAYAFYCCYGISDASGLSRWDVANATNMSNAFYSTGITDLDAFRAWDLAEVTNVQSMFDSCSSLTDITAFPWDTAASLKDADAYALRRAFSYCGSVSVVSVDQDNPVSSGVLNTLPTNVRSAQFTDGDETVPLQDVIDNKAGKSGIWTRVGARSLAASLDPMANPLNSWDAEPTLATEPLAIDALAAESAATVANGTSGTIEWSLDSEGTLLIKPKTGRTFGTLPSSTAPSGVPWDGYRDQVLAVVIDGNVSMPRYNGYYLFTKMTNLTDVSGMASLDVNGRCVSFQGCSSLADISPLSAWDMTGVSETLSMFQDCPSLDDISALAAWNLADVTRFEKMFAGTTMISDTSVVATWNIRDDLPTSGNMNSTVVRVGDWTKTLGVNPNLLSASYQYVGNEDDLFESRQTGERVPISEILADPSTHGGVWDRANVRKATIRFEDPKGLQYVTMPDDMEFEPGTMVSLPSVHGGTLWQLAGWSTQVNADPDLPAADGGLIVPAIEGVVMDVPEDRDTVTLYAQWKRAPVLLRFYDSAFDGSWTDWDSHEVWSGSVDAETGLDQTPSVKAPSGRRLVGWEVDGVDDSFLPFGPTGTIPEEWVHGGSVSFYPVFEALPGTAQVSSGSVNFMLTAGQSVVLPSLPGGASYKVWEETDSGWHLVSSENAEGVLVPGQTAEAVFTNSYDPGTVVADIHATKDLVGGDDAGMTAAGFLFELVDSDGTVVGTAYSGPSGAVDLRTPEISSAGTYTYTVREAAEQPMEPNSVAISYDDTERTVVVEVADDGQGRLSAEVTYDGAGMSFVNSVDPGTVTVRKESRNGTNLMPDPDQLFHFVAIFEDGHTEEFDLKAGESKALTGPAWSEVSVQEVDIPEGWYLESFNGVSGSEGRDPGAPRVKTFLSGQNVEERFTNIYDPGRVKVDLSARKTVTGSRVTPAFTFEATLTESSISWPIVYKAPEAHDAWFNGIGGSITASNYDDGLIEFPGLYFTYPGTYTFEIHEVAGTSSAYTYDGTTHTATVTVTDDGHGRLSAEVSYDGSPVPPTFTNTVATKAVEVEKRVAEGYHDAAGETFLMRLSLGTVDASVLEALQITAAEAASALTVDGEPYTAGEVFEVAAGQTVTVEGPAAIVDAIEAVTEDEVAGYTAKVSEEEVEGTRRFVVTNTYAASGTFSVGATKTLDGREPGDESFTFTLTDPDGNLAAKATNDASGAVTMDGLEVFEPGTYRYTLAEADDGRAGVVFDDRTVGVVVTATDVGSGVLSCEVSYDGSPEPPVFENTTGTPVAMPSTGSAGLPWAISVCGAAAALLAARIRARRRRDR